MVNPSTNKNCSENNLYNVSCNQKNENIIEKYYQQYCKQFLKLCCCSYHAPPGPGPGGGGINNLEKNRHIDNVEHNNENSNGKDNERNYMNRNDSKIKLSDSGADRNELNDMIRLDIKNSERHRNVIRHVEKGIAEIENQGNSVSVVRIDEGIIMEDVTRENMSISSSGNQCKTISSPTITFDEGQSLSLSLISSTLSLSSSSSSLSPSSILYTSTDYLTTAAAAAAAATSRIETEAETEIGTVETASNVQSLKTTTKSTTITTSTATSTTKSSSTSSTASTSIFTAAVIAAKHHHNLRRTNHNHHHNHHNHHRRRRTLSGGLVWLLIGLVWLEGPLLISCKMNNNSDHLIKINSSSSSNNRVTTIEQQNKKFDMLSNNKRFNKIYKNTSSNTNTKSNNSNNGGSSRNTNNSNRNRNNNNNDNSNSSNDNTNKNKNENTTGKNNNNSNNSSNNNKKNNNRKHNRRNYHDYHDFTDLNSYEYDKLHHQQRRLQDQIHQEDLHQPNTYNNKQQQKQQHQNLYDPVGLAAIDDSANLPTVSSMKQTYHTPVHLENLNFKYTGTDQLRSNQFQKLPQYHQQLYQQYQEQQQQQQQQQQHQQHQQPQQIHQGFDNFYLDENTRKSLLASISCPNCVFNQQNDNINPYVSLDPSTLRPIVSSSSSSFSSGSPEQNSHHDLISSSDVVPSPSSSSSSSFPQLSPSESMGYPQNHQQSNMFVRTSQKINSNYKIGYNEQRQPLQFQYQLRENPQKNHFSKSSAFSETPAINNNYNNRIILSAVNTDTLRLESIKHQILSKLGLKHKPNVTHPLPKQFIMDTLYRADGGSDYVSFNFGFDGNHMPPSHKHSNRHGQTQNQHQRNMSQNQKQNRQKSHHQQQQQYNKYKGQKQQKQQRPQYQSTMPQSNTRTSSSSSISDYASNNNDFSKNINFKTDYENQNQQRFDDSVNIHDDTQALTNNNNNYNQSLIDNYNNNHNNNGEYDDDQINSNYYHINMNNNNNNGDNLNGYYNFDNEQMANYHQQSDDNHQSEHYSRDHQQDSISSYSEPDDFFGSTKEIITFAEKGQMFNGHRLVEFTSPSDQLPGQYLSIRSATIWVRIDIRTNIPRNRYDRLWNVTNFKIWIFRLRGDFLENKNFDELTTLCASVNVSLLNLGWQKIDVTSTVREWYEQNRNDRLRLLIDCTGCNDLMVLHLFEDDFDNQYINRKANKQKQKHLRNPNNRQQHHHHHNYEDQHLYHHHRHHKNQRLDRNHFRLQDNRTVTEGSPMNSHVFDYYLNNSTRAPSWKAMFLDNSRQQSIQNGNSQAIITTKTTKTTTTTKTTSSTINPNRPFLVIHTEPNRVRRVRRRAIDCTGAVNGQCCKESFYVSFKALGWDDWIIAPHGYFANYCRGDCSGPYRTPDTFQSYHTHVMEEFRKMDRLNGMQPCCAPLKFSSMSLIYYGNEGIIKRDLPKMVVDECGCP